MGFEQIVLNQVTEAIHIIHFVKNLGDKLMFTVYVKIKFAQKNKQEP